MANLKASKKSAVTSEQKRCFNSSKKSRIKTFIKKVNVEILLKNKEKAKLEFKKAQSILDRYATKGIIHKNKAARHKSNLERRIKLIV
ncbi:MAG: 30S ribosomal protein S20 [Buchnera aphidicola (Meitanaphis flavogallis)]